MLFSQTTLTSVFYFTDFEDKTDNANWTLNSGPMGGDCASKWYFGKSGANMGEYGLFVSGDGGLNCGYTKNGVSVVAYRELTFDEGDYVLSFDWQAGGMQTDGMYVCWIPKDSVANLNSVNTSMLQKWVISWALDFGGDSLRLGQRSWNVVSDTIHSDGTPHRLVFVWNNSVAGVYPPAVAIDNILIMECGNCEIPTNLIANNKGDEIVLSWQGNADSYDIRCCANMTGEWFEFDDVVNKYQVVSGLPEGICTFYVRSNCNGVDGAWVSTTKFLFYPGTRCVNYLDLNSKNCYSGTVIDPMMKKEVIDFGYQAIESRHTIHWNAMEYDPRTLGADGSKLKTVPDGEIASVRLGNWASNAEAECIEYNYIVDTLNSAILLLNYAVVLEDPEHDSIQQPRFMLQILYKDEPLDEYGCGEAYFSAGHNTFTGEGWHQLEQGWWKDWTTIAINLGKYHGKSLKIRLTTLDCSLGGHYGYAYFTLGCSDGKIKGLTCGGSDSTKFQGPEGFEYRWYLPSNPEKIISTSRILSLPGNDTLTYNLDVIQPTNRNCYYTLQASAIGRWPVARAVAIYESTDCKNVVSFENNSCIRRINQVSKETVETQEKCESYLWDFGDGTFSTEENPIHTFPDTGGQYMVKLSAGIADGLCMHDTIIVVNLPEVGLKRDTIDAVVCKGTPYMFNGTPYYYTGCYSDTLKTYYGCDSISTLNLFMAIPKDTLVYDTICSDEDYYFAEEKIEQSGEYVYKGESIYGCDSIVTLKILVNQAFHADFDSLASVCIDDSEIRVSYELVSGFLDVYTAQIISNTDSFTIENLMPQGGNLVIPMPEDIEPGRYSLQLKFGEKSCDTSIEGKVIPLEIYYSKDILVQRWGDVLAVTNELYNGGYSFVFFQWFKNGVAIEGATSSILYLEEGLDLTAQYSVLLTRGDNNVTLMTCDADLIDFGQEESQVVVFSEDNSTVNVSSRQNAKVKIWLTSGLLLTEAEIFKGENAINLAKGMYIFEFIFEDNRHEIEQVIVN